MRKNIYIIAIILIISLMEVSCGKDIDENVNSIDNFFKLVDSDKENDRKSVYWDGNKASVVDDIMDDKYITDGRFGLRMQSELIENDDWVIRIDTYNKEYNIICNEPDKFVVETDTIDKEDFKLYCSIQELDKSYTDICNEFNNDTDWRNISSDHKIMRNSYGVERYELYLGVDTEKEMAGHIGIVEGCNGKVYEIEFIGKGKLNDILGLSLNTLDSFDIIIV